MEVKIKKIRQNVTIPTRGSKEAAGSDIFACIEEEIKIKPHETVKIPTGFATEMLDRTVALVYSRSGIATKRSLVVCQALLLLTVTIEANGLYQYIMIQTVNKKFLREKELHRLFLQIS